jgi:YidC/Oxa1 family membrane protein insertase
MDMVRTADNPAWYPLQLSIPGLPRDADWTLEKLSDTEVRASWREDGKLEVIKKFTVKPPLYAMEMSIEITNLASQEVEQHLAVDLFGFQDPNTGSSGMFKYVPPTWGTVCYQDGKARGDSVGSLIGREPKQRGGAVKYAGLQHKYFLLAVAPKPSDDRYSCTLAAAPDRPGVMLATLNYATTVKLPPQQKMVRQLVVYSGPKLLGQLEQVSKLLGGDTQLTATVDWGPPPTRWFTFIARPMLWLLGVFHGWVANWGIAIILLTITVKLLTLYWTQKSMRSMKSMAKLKPKMDEIRAKWPGDKQRQNQEMMNLYKTHNINPLGGCLPMLLQMPVWMALYSALGAAAELYQAPFVGWLDDLTAPDPYFIMPVSLTTMMFLQSKLSPAAVDSAQQKMMMYFMPIMFGFFSLFFPTGLTVYIFTNTVLGMAHQVYMNKTDAAAAPAPAKATAPAGDAQAARPAQAPPRKKKKKAS